MMSLTFIAAAPGPVSPPLWRVLTEMGYFTALALAAGYFMASAFLLPASARTGAAGGSLRAIALPIALLVSVGGYAQYAARIARSKLGYAFTDSLSPTHIAQYVAVPAGEGEWIGAGAMATVQLALFGVVAALIVVAARSGGRTSAAVAAAGFVLVMLAASAPSFTSSFPTIGAAASRVLTVTHVLACVIWLGGIFVLGAAGFRARRSGADGAGAFERMWAGFSVWAMGAVVAVSVSGLWLAWVHVGSFGQFVSTPYGRFLLVKLVLVAFMVVAGAYNVRVLIPALRRARLAGDEGTAIRLALHHFPKVVAAEAIAGIAVLAIVPFLTGSARKQAGSAAAGPFDWEAFGVGAFLVALLVGGCVAAVRTVPERTVVALTGHTGPEVA